VEEKECETNSEMKAKVPALKVSSGSLINLKGRFLSMLLLLRYSEREREREKECNVTGIVETGE